MNIGSNINTNTNRSKPNTTREKRAAASTAAAGRRTPATAAAALCVQLYYCCLSDALIWSACGDFKVSTWGSQTMSVLLRGYACVFCSTHDSIT